MHQSSVISDRTDPDRMTHDLYRCVHSVLYHVANTLIERTEEGDDDTELTFTITTSRQPLDPIPYNAKPGHPHDATLLVRFPTKNGVYQFVNLRIVSIRNVKEARL